MQYNRVRVACTPPPSPKSALGDTRGEETTRVFTEIPVVSLEVILVGDTERSDRISASQFYLKNENIMHQNSTV